MTTAQENLPANVTPVNGVLVGSIIGYGGVVSGNAQAPAGWLFCDGSAVSRATYSDLFGVIGNQHGSGDGSTTFNLPDHRGQFHRGVDDGTGNDPDSTTRTAANPGGATGDLVGSVQGTATARPAGGQFTTDSQGDHVHSIDHVPTESSHSYVSASHYAAWNQGSADTDSGGGHSHSTTAGGGDADTCPINVYVNYLIYCGTTS